MQKGKAVRPPPLSPMEQCTISIEDSLNTSRSETDLSLNTSASVKNHK